MENRLLFLRPQKNLHLILGSIALSVVVFVCLQIKQQFYARAFAPVLPLGGAPEEFRPVVYALRDPMVLKRRPEDAAEAERLALEIKEIRTGIERLSGARALEQHEQAYLGFAALGSFFQDQVRRADSEAEAAKGRQSYNNVAQLLESHASAAAQLASDGRGKARAQYFYYASRYSRFGISSQETSSIVGKLESLVEGGQLSADLRQRAQFVVATHRLGSSDRKVRSKAAAQVVSLGRKMEPSARVGGWIQLARHSRRLAEGQSEGFKRYLMQASLKSTPLHPAEKSLVIRELVAIWRSHDRKALSASPAGGTLKVPFSLAPFKETLEFLALAERSALVAWEQNQGTKAIARYEQLAKRLGDHPQGLAFKGAVDLRTVDLWRALETSSAGRNQTWVTRYEKALNAKEKSYLDLGVLGPARQAEAQRIREKIVSYRRDLAHRELNRAGLHGSHNAAIRLAESFLSDHPRDPDQVMLREKIASSYVATKNYDPAVSIYRELAQGSQTQQKRRYLTLAIGAQSLRAEWPVKVPWDRAITPSEESLTHRELLKSLYAELQSLDPNDWFVAAHIGHLDIHVGQGEKTFQDWQARIARFPRDYHASQAAGWMMTAYEKAQNWAKLEDTARLCLKSGVSGTFRGQTVSPQVKLGLALLESGKKSLTEKDYALAVTKLKEFSFLRPTPARHDEGYFSLTLAYWGNRQYRDSVQTTLQFVETYPRSSYTRQALLNGGDWSTMLTYEENALALHGRFLKQFPNDPQAPRVRQGLYELTMGRELYGEALELLADEQRGHQSAGNAAQVAQLETKMMTLEESHGSMSRALRRAKVLVDSPDATDTSKASAYRLMIRNAGRSGQHGTIRQYLTSLDNLGDSQERREAKAEGLLMVANAESKAAIKEYFNLELTDPHATLQERYRVFTHHKNNYLAVCSVGTTASCGPALHQLARLSENFGASLEDINVQKTLAKSEVDRFQKRKQSILTSISRTTIEADQGSMQSTMVLQKTGTTAQGPEAGGEVTHETDPQWVEGVNWQNEAQWTSNRPQGLGSGFLQWPEKKAGVAP